MSLSDLASLGGFVSGVAVAVTLLFTLFQLRQNNRAIRASMQQNRTARYAEQILRPTEPFLCQVVTKASEGNIEMRSDQVMAFVRHTASIFWNSEDVFLQNRLGTLDQEAFDSDVALLKGFLSIPAYRVGWKFNRHYASGEFQKFIDELVSETKMTPTVNFESEWKLLMTEELAATAR
jgi:hypothetical protein